MGLCNTLILPLSPNPCGRSPGLVVRVLCCHRALLLITHQFTTLESAGVLWHMGAPIRTIPGLGDVADGNAAAHTSDITNAPGFGPDRTDLWCPALSRAPNARRRTMPDMMVVVIIKHEPVCVPCGSIAAVAVTVSSIIYSVYTYTTIIASG